MERDRSSNTARPSAWAGRWWAIALVVPLVAGCHNLPGAYPPPPQEPRTVSEWLKQPRVGEDLKRVN